MSNVQFEEDNMGMQQMKARSTEQTGAVVAWFIKMGIIKDESNSKGVLITVVIINLIATALVIYYFI
jgi:hypothetical protein